MRFFRFSAAVSIGILILAGCQAHSEHKVLSRLPQPAVVEGLALTPAIPPATKPSTPSAHDAAPPPPGWLPLAGLAHRWNAIVIHHTASDSGSLHDIDQWHRGKGWDCCGYHFVIGNGTNSGDGQIEVGPRWRDQITGAHTRLFGAPSSPEGNYYNEHGIGIVLVGNFDKQGPSARQMAALVRLVTFLTRNCVIPTQRVYLHGELKSTDCPGRYFSKARLQRQLLDALASARASRASTGG